MKVLIDLFDHSGHAARPYRENGWHVLQIDIKHGIDILTWDYKSAINGLIHPKSENIKSATFGILAAIPCTDYALCGATHFAKKDANGETAKSQLLVDKTKEIIDYVKESYNLKFWRVENPMSRIHSLNPWLGKIHHKFDPCEYAGYLNIDPAELQEVYNWSEQVDMSKMPKHLMQKIWDWGIYNKQTWLWGNFNKPVPKKINPAYKEFPGHVLFGGKSERTKELRSVDPKGFCQAFYLANN